MIVDNGRKWLYARHTAWICLQFIASWKNMCKILPVLKRHKKTAFLPLACNTYVLHNAIIAHCSRLPSPAHSVIHRCHIIRFVATACIHTVMRWFEWKRVWFCHSTNCCVSIFNFEQIHFSIEIFSLLKSDLKGYWN